MNLADELRKLQEMHRTGGLTDAEFAAAKAAVLGTNTNASDTTELDAVQARLQKVELQNELARIDKDWEQERGYYTFYTQFGPWIPGPVYCVVTAIFGVGMGSLFAFLMATTVDGPWPLPLVMFAVPGLGISFYLYYNWTQYEAAFHAYEERRRSKWREANNLPAKAPSAGAKSSDSHSTEITSKDNRPST